MLKVMCQFNLAITNINIDEKRIEEVFAENQLRFSVEENKSINEILNKKVYVSGTCKGMCDCDSFLGISDLSNSLERKVEKEIEKLRKKGWKENKINRYLKEKGLSEGKKYALRVQAEENELNKWENTIKECFDKSLLKWFGVLIHNFETSPSTEEFIDLKQEEVDFSNFDINYLKSLEFDKLLIIRNDKYHKEIRSNEKT